SARRRQPAVVLGALAVALLILAVARLFIGERMGWPRGDTASYILDTRLQRAALAIAAGVALACAGVALQALLRNPLAEPFVLGLSSGAALGIMAQSLLAYHLGRSLGGGYLGALTGAAASMGIVYTAGRRRGTIDPIGLLLVGVA